MTNFVVKSSLLLLVVFCLVSIINASSIGKNNNNNNNKSTGTVVGSSNGKPQATRNNRRREQIDQDIETKTRTKRRNSRKTILSSSNKQRTSSKLSPPPASATLRRIKKEYKDAVQMGIAYDWSKGQPVTRSKVSTSSNTGETNLQQQQQHPPPVCIGPLTSNLHHWHFTFRGCGIYEEGIYHGRILLPKEYPATPPRVQLWTPSGRFIPYADICLSASAYHPESWTPRWTILSLVQALRLHMLTNPQEIGGMTSSREDTLEYARKSLTWKITWKAGKSHIVTIDHALMLQQQRTLLLDQEEEEEDTQGVAVEEEDDDDNDENDENEEINTEGKEIWNGRRQLHGGALKRAISEHDGMTNTDVKLQRRMTETSLSHVLLQEQTKKQREKVTKKKQKSTKKVATTSSIATSDRRKACQPSSRTDEDDQQLQAFSSKVLTTARMTLLSLLLLFVILNAM